MTTPTKSSAISYARKNVSQLYPCGGGYQYNRYDAGCQAWRSSTARDIYQARASRSQALIDLACQHLGIDAPKYDGGPWIDYIPA
jgi:hypothetical protein